MIPYSILIPQPRAIEEVGRQAAAVASQLDRLGGDFEIIPIHDDGDPAARRVLDDLAASRPWLRVLSLDRPRGTSAALSAGFAAVRGEVVVAIEAGDQYLPEQIPWLLNRLARADLVVGRRQCRRLTKTYRSLAQIPRRLLLGADSRDPDCLFWAARREALAGLELAPGMHRFLASLVSMRGFRVCEINVDHRPQPRRRGEGPPTAINLFAAWRQRRAWQAILAEEAAARRVDLERQEPPAARNDRRGLAA